MTGFPEERHRAPRKLMPLVVTLFIEGDNVGYGTNPRNVSIQGMHLQTDAPLAVGQRVRLLINEDPTPIPARVIWLRKPESEQVGEAGIEFLVSDASPV